MTSSEVDSGYYPTQMTSSEVDTLDSGYYPTQMERRDWSDSCVYVTIINFTKSHCNLQRADGNRFDYLICLVLIIFQENDD